MNATNPSPAQTFKSTFGVWPVQAMTLKLTVEEGYRMSYIGDLKACVAAGLVVFGNLGRGTPTLTEKGRKALEANR